MQEPRRIDGNIEGCKPNNSTVCKVENRKIKGKSYKNKAVKNGLEPDAKLI